MNIKQCEALSATVKMQQLQSMFCFDSVVCSHLDDEYEKYASVEGCYSQIYSRKVKHPI